VGSRGVAEGRFYYRINVIPVAIPPLRDRSHDILPLAQQFMREFSEKFDRDIQGFTPEAKQAPLSHPWPGNARELRNCAERAIALSRAPRIGVEALFFGEAAEPDRPRPARLTEFRDRAERQCRKWVKRSVAVAIETRRDLRRPRRTHDGTVAHQGATMNHIWIREAMGFRSLCLVAFFGATLGSVCVADAAVTPMQTFTVTHSISIPSYSQQYSGTCGNCATAETIDFTDTFTPTPFDASLGALSSTSLFVSGTGSYSYYFLCVLGNGCAGSNAPLLGVFNQGTQVFLSSSVAPNTNGFAPLVGDQFSATGNGNQPPGAFINETFVTPSNIAGFGFGLPDGAPDLTLVTRFLVGEQGLEVVPPDPSGYPIEISDLVADATFTVGVQYTYGNKVLVPEPTSAALLLTAFFLYFGVCGRCIRIAKTRCERELSGVCIADPVARVTGA
jgi:hypothetical protein